MVYLLNGVNRRSSCPEMVFQRLRNALKILQCRALPSLTSAALNGRRLYGGGGFLMTSPRVVRIENIPSYHRDAK